MKKTIAFLLCLVMILFLCACGRKAENISANLQNALDDITPLDDTQEASTIEESQYSSEIVDSTPKEGCFYDSVKIIYDNFGEKTGENHVLRADAIGYTKEGKREGKVTVLLNDQDKFWKDSFYFVITDDTISGGSISCNLIYYKIEDNEYIFSTKEYNQDSQNNIMANTIPYDCDDYYLIYDALYEGKDVKFSFRGDYICTIHGEGFKELVSNIPN